MEHYRLLPHRAGITISVPHQCENLVARVSGELPLVQQYEQEGKLAFVNTEHAWGMGGALVREHTAKGMSFIAPFFTCGSHNALSQSLNLLQLALTPLNEGPKLLAPLVALNGLSSGTGNSAYDMSVELSPLMVSLVKHFTERHRTRIEDTMRITINTLGDTRTYPFTCSTKLVLSLVVPGEETWLACDHEPVPNGFARMSGHNIDHSYQQFALLAGLAEAQVGAEEIRASS